MNRRFPTLKKVTRAALSRLEPLTLPRGATLRYPPLFIVGPPRSGTTLVYLLLTHRYRLSYISNFMTMSPLSPVLMGWLGRPFRLGRGPRNFHSYFGETDGWRGPNQGYRLWNLSFPIDSDFVPPSLIMPETARALRRTIAGIERLGRGPFVNKWQRNAARIEALDKIFPNALFLRVTRDPVETARSLLAGRIKLTGNDQGWFSARPTDMPDTSHMSPAAQVSYQAVLMDLQIEKSLARLAPSRSYTIDYRGLCDDPVAVLDEVAQWYQAQSGHCLRIRRSDLPALRPSPGAATQPDADREIRACCARLLEKEVV